jgi:membrane-associated protein
MATVSPGRSRGGTTVDSITDWLIAFVSEQDNPLALAALAGSALIEYVFPPFPGDTVTLGGAILITAYDWSFLPIYLAVLAGSMAGAMAAFWLGGVIERKRGAHDVRAIDRLVARFERHGAGYLVVNRFLPGFRAFFFVAAGMARMPWQAVLVWGTLSAALWNLAVIGAGAAIGANFDTLRLWLTRYTVAVWIALGAVALALLVRWWWNRRRRAA